MTTHRTRVRNFAATQSMTAVPIGEHLLAVPGRHEARALTDMCPQCTRLCEPASVLDVTDKGRSTGRLGTYRCTVCEAAWLCSWASAADMRATAS